MSLAEYHLQWSEETEERFLREVAETGAPAKAARHAGVRFFDVTREMSINPDFADAVACAEAEYLQHLAEKAVTMAGDGHPKMLEFVLTRRDPKRWHLPTILQNLSNLQQQGEEEELLALPEDIRNDEQIRCLLETLADRIALLSGHPGSDLERGTVLADKKQE